MASETDTRCAPAYRLMTHAQVLEIHQAALQILETVGVRVLHAGGVQLLKAAGCRLDHDNIVHIPAPLVETAIAKCSFSHTHLPIATANRLCSWKGITTTLVWAPI